MAAAVLTANAVKYIPSWFPGAAFKRQAAKWKTSVDALFEEPFRAAKIDYVSLIVVKISRNSYGYASRTPAVPSHA